MLVRPAGPADLDATHRMGYDAWGEGRTLDAHLAACRAAPKYAAGVWWVGAREDGVPECSLLAHEIPLPEGAPACGLGSIATAPERRGRGLASRLIAEVLARREAAGVEVFFLFSDIAPAFYERFGFRSLQPCPGKPATMLMARAKPAALAALLSNPAFRLPAYF